MIIAEYHEGAPESSTAGTPSLAAEMAASPVFAKIAQQTVGEGRRDLHGPHAQDVRVRRSDPGITGRTRPIVQTGNYGENIGRVTLTVDDDIAGDPVVSYTATNVARAGRREPRDSPASPRSSRSSTRRSPTPRRSATRPVGSVDADITTAFSGGTYTGPGGTYTGGHP